MKGYRKLIRQLIFKLFGKRAYMNWCTRDQLRTHGQHRYKDPEQKFLDRFIHPGDICLDVGANLGSYSFFMSHLVGKNGAIYAFEPVRSTFEGLQTFIARGKLTNVQPLNMGLSDQAGRSRIFVPRIDGVPGHGRATLAQQTDGVAGECEEVKVTTLDDFCANANLPHIDFVKIDIEGAELLALRGGVKTVCQHRPVLLLEIEGEHTREFGYQPMDLIQHLRDQGYHHMLYCNNLNLFEVDDHLLTRDGDVSRVLTLELGHTVNNFYFVTSEKFSLFRGQESRLGAT
jgi:FkbM family methyltransferase